MTGCYRILQSKWAALRPFPVLMAVLLIALTGCNREANPKPSAEQKPPVEIQMDLKVPFRFVAYGDARFHDPTDFEDSNPPVRVALVQAVAAADPAFICFTGDLIFNGYDPADWNVWDSETSIWKEKKIPVYPALGNHEVRAKVKLSLANYFQRFPYLENNRFYSVRAGNVLVLVLDSALDEMSGPQGQWLTGKLDHVPPDVDFVFVIMHHPPYTSSTESMTGEGHSARSMEMDLAKDLEERQAHTRYRFVVISGHVHNYERHEHGGITYFVSGGGAAHAYPVVRQPSDPFQSTGINYHYLLVEVDKQQAKVTMNRIEMVKGKPVWTTPDSRTITVPAASGQ